MSISLPTAKPILQPGILNVFDIDVNSTATDLAPGTCKIEGGGFSPKYISAYARSDSIQTSFCFATLTNSS